MGDQRGVAGTLAGTPGVSVASGDFVRATRLLGAATALAESVQASHLVHHEQYERVRSAARAGLDGATFAQVWTSGREMTPADISTLLKEIVPGQDVRSNSSLARKRHRITALSVGVCQADVRAMSVHTALSMT